MIFRCAPPELEDTVPYTPRTEMGQQAAGLPQSRLTRTGSVAFLAARVAARWVLARLPGFGSAGRRERLTKAAGEDVARTTGAMKGAAMKVGQVLSMMTGFVPSEFSEQLTGLYDSAPPMPWPTVEQVLRDAYGGRLSRVFRDIEEEPFAAASIGQVHRAVLRDGSRVAVKVQYPGVRDAVRHDLANLGALVTLLAQAAPGLNGPQIASDLRAGIEAELDYVRECENQRRFYERFAGHPFIRVPRPFPELVRPTVLVQEYLEGRPLREAMARPEAERNRIAEIIFRFAFGSLYRFGLFNGDPHPGNYLLLPNGAVGFVDYGCVASFDRAVLEKFGRVIRAVVRREKEEWRRAVEDVGILRRDAPFATEELFEHMHWYWAPILEPEVTFTPELAAEMVRRNTETTGRGGEINRYCSIPEGMVFLTRINFGLAGMLGSLRARGPWQAITLEYVDGNPPSTELGRISAAWARGGLSV